MNPELLVHSDRRIVLAESLPGGEFTKVRRGAYYPTQAWQMLDDDARHALLVHASVPVWHDHLVVSHRSAAALWGLPVIGGWPRGVEVTVPDRTRTSQGGLVVHRTATMPDWVERDGVRLTSPLRTVIDLARLLPIPYSLAAADHAVRHGLTTSSALLHSARALAPGARGRTKARTVAQLADPRAESPLESLSRGVMFMSLLPRPDLQVRVYDADGEFLGRTDFGWPGLLGECDGAMKYGADCSDGDPSRAVWREKRREDRLREVCDMTRWDWDDAFRNNGARLLHKLHAKGIRPAPDSRDTWLPAR